MIFPSRLGVKADNVTGGEVREVSKKGKDDCETVELIVRRSSRLRRSKPFMRLGN